MPLFESNPHVAALPKKKKKKPESLGLGGEAGVSAPKPTPRPAPVRTPPPGSRSRRVEDDIANITKGYKQATGFMPAPDKVVELVGSGGSSADYYQMFSAVSAHKTDRIATLTKAHEAQELATLPSSKASPSELWGDFIAPGEPDIDLGVGTTLFSWSPFPYIGPGAKSWLDEQKRLATEWPTPIPVAELLSGLAKGREDQFRRFMVDDLGFTDESSTDEMARRYVFGAYLISALEAEQAPETTVPSRLESGEPRGANEAEKRLHETGILPPDMSVREWVDTVLSPDDEKRKQQIMQAAQLGRDPRQTYSDWLVNFAKTEWCPQSVKDELDGTIAKGLLDTTFMAMGDLTGLAQGAALTAQGAEAAARAAETSAGLDRTTMRAAAAAAGALEKVFTSPMYLERAAGAVGVGMISAAMSEGDVEGVRRIGKAVVFSLAANDDIGLWESAKVAIDNTVKTWKANSGELAAWQWAKAAGFDTSNEWIAAGCLTAELVFQGMLGRGMDAMTKGAVRVARNSGIVKQELSNMGVLSPEQLWARTENPFVIRHTAQNSGVLMRAKDASHLAKVESPRLVREYVDTSDSIVHLGREIDFATPSMAVHRRVAELMDTGKSARQRLWRLPMQDRMLDLGEVADPDFKVYVYATYHNLGPAQALRLAGEMTHALADNHPDGLTPLQVAEKVDEVIIASYRSKPASAAYRKKSNNPEATRYDEVMYEQNKRRPRSEAQEQSSYLAGAPGRTNTNIRPDAAYSRESIAALKAAEGDYRKQIREFNKEKAAARQTRLEAAGLKPLGAKPAMKTSEGGYKTRVVGTEVGDVDAGIAPHVAALNKAGYKTFGSHSSLKTDHPQGHPSRNMPGYIEFEADSPAIRAVAEKHGLEVEPTADAPLVPEAESGMLYHGAPAGTLTFIDPYASRFFPSGFYTTESPVAAAGYAAGRTTTKAGRAEAKSRGAVNYVKGEPRKVVDLDADIDTAMWQGIAEKLGVEADLAGARTNQQGYRRVLNAIADEHGGAEGASLATVREFESGITDQLYNLGYDAFVRKEGVKTTPHKVTIWIPRAVEEGAVRLVNPFSTAPAAQTPPRLLVRNPKTGKPAQILWQKFTNDLLDEAIPASEAEGVLAENIAKAEAARQRLIGEAAGSVERRAGPVTDRDLANHYDWKIDQRTGALVNSGLHRNPLSEVATTWERNLSVADEMPFVPWYDLVNGFVPELMDKPLPVVGAGGKAGLRSAETVQEHGINQITKARKMVALAKISTIAIIIGADEFIRSAVWAFGATGANPKALLGVISRRLEDRGFTGVTEDLQNLFESSPEFREQFLPSLLQDKQRPTRLDVQPGHPEFPTAVKQEVATFNAADDLTGSQVCRDWYRGLLEGEQKFGHNTPEAYEYARDAFYKLVEEDPYYTKEGSPGYELKHMRSVSGYARRVLHLPSLVENWAEGIDLAARARCQNPVTRRHFVGGSSAVKPTDFKNPEVAKIYGETPLTADMTVTNPNAWQRIRVNPAPGANLAKRTGAGVFNTVWHPVDAMFELLGSAGVRLKRESFAAFYKDALKSIESQRPHISPEDARYEAMHVAFSKTKSISYMAEHSFLEDSLRNVIMFLPAYKQFAKFWGTKAVQNVWMTSVILNDLLDRKEQMNKAAGDVLDKVLGTVPGIKGAMKTLPIETTFFDVTDREGNIALRNIMPPLNLVAQDVLGLASAGSESARSVYETISGGYAPNAPIHGPAEALLWATLPDSLRMRYQEATGDLEGTASLVDNRYKRTVLNMAKQYASGQPIDYEKAIGSNNPFDPGGTRGFERGVAFTKFIVPMRTQKILGMMKVVPEMNNGKALTVDLDRINEGQRQYLSAPDGPSRSAVLDMFPEYRPVARAYGLKGNKQLAYLAKHRWVVPFVVLVTESDDHYQGPRPVIFEEEAAARVRLDPKDVADSINGRINQIDRFLLAQRYAPQKVLIESGPLKALAAYDAWRKNKRAGRDDQNPLADVDSAEIAEARRIVSSFKGEKVSESAVNRAYLHLTAGLEIQFEKANSKELDRVIRDRDNWTAEMSLADGGHPTGWKKIYPTLGRLWDTGEDWAQQLVRDSKFYPDFIAQRNEDAAAKKKDATFFALLNNKSRWLTNTENEAQVFEVMRAVGFTGKDKVLRAQIDDMLPYVEAIDIANRQIARSFEERGDAYYDAVLQRDIQIEALRQRYPELKYSTAQWMHELGYDEFRLTHPDYPGLGDAQGAKHLAPTTLKRIKQWSREMAQTNAFNAQTFPDAKTQAESLRQWRGYLAKWKKAYSSTDPEIRPALDELSRANAWWVMWGVAEGVRKTMLGQGITAGSKAGKAVVAYLDTIYQDMRVAAPAFATEVDEVFGKKDFIKYMIDPRRETSPNLKAVKAGAKALQNADSLVNYAETLIGVPSKSYGPYSLDDGLSCSAFTAHVMSRFGVELEAFTGAQYPKGTHVTGSNSERGDVAKLLPGDLVFKVTRNPEFTDDYGFGHVAIYIGNGRIIEANNGPSVAYGSLSSWTSPWEARRYLRGVR